MRAFFTVALTLFAAASQAAVRFEPPLFLNKAASATSVAVADIDGDGALDVVAAVPARAMSITLSDLNQDGVADIIANTSDGVYNLLSSQRHYGAAQLAGKPDLAITKRITINGAPSTVTMDGRSTARSQARS